MASSSSSSSGGAMQRQVLATATRIKLRELNAHEQRLRAHYEALLTAAQLSADGRDDALQDGTPTVKRARLETLYNGTKDLQIVQTKLHPNLAEVGALVQFAQSDPWTTRQSLAQRQQQLLREIRQRRSLWRHNKLLGALLHESLQEETTTPSEAAAEGATGLDDDDGDKGVAKMTKEETQAQLEKYFFSPAHGVSEQSVYEYLETHIFHKRATYSTEQWTQVQTKLSETREALHDMSETFCRHVRVKTHEVDQAVALLLRNSSSFTDDVVAFLSDVKANTTTQRELAHVLTIELSNLREFKWSDEGIPVQFLRGMNGRWRCHLKEDAVSLLLFQYVGMKWSETVRHQFPSLLNALDEPGSRCSSTVLGNSAAATHRELRDIFTLAALKDGSYDESGETSYGLESASKQDLLRLLCAEARYQRVFHDDTQGETEPPSITAVTTDLEFFGPSVSHAAVLGCLKFFGVDDDARAIFAQYMKIPLVFPDFDSPRVMQRGLSVGRAMTMFLSEILLFVMDFAVRSETGIHLFRRHDDIIFYDTKPENVTAAWETMQQWARVAGLRFNADKSGSARLQWSPTTPSTSSPPPSLVVPASLPPKPIQWGLLELQSNASVRILQDQVDAYAKELADRLAHATTVFGWINVYNKYMRFFLRSFGNVSPVFGPSHVREMTATLQRIHRKVFPDSNGDVLAYLRDRITHDHSDLVPRDAELPGAWTQWPLELGGLGLFNPFLAIWSLEPAMRTFLATHHTRAAEPWPKEETAWPWREPFTTTRDRLLAEYQKIKDAVDRDGGSLTALLQSKKARDLFAYVTSDTISDASRDFGKVRWNYTDEKNNATAGWRLRTRQEFLDTVFFTAQQGLQNEFKACLMQVHESAPPTSGAETKLPSRIAAETQLIEAGLSTAPYWQWQALLTSETLMDEFGTVAFFSSELLPAQLIETIKKTSVAW